MNPASGHFEAELQDLLDGRLEPGRRAAVEAHAAGCARCGRELAALRWVRDAASNRIPTEPVPADLAARVGAALDAAAAEEKAAARRPLVHARRSMIVATALAAAAAVLFLVARRSDNNLTTAVARDFRDVQAQTLHLEFASSEPTAIEAFFAARAVPFQSRVFDLAAMDYHLVGARVHDLNGRLSALYAYRGPDGRMIVCQMYLGNAIHLRPPEDTRTSNGVTFYVYHEGPVTLVFWQERDLVCVLASDAPAETVIQLAVAKAGGE